MIGQGRKKKERPGRQWPSFTAPPAAPVSLRPGEASQRCQGNVESRWRVSSGLQASRPGPALSRPGPGPCFSDYCGDGGPCLSWHISPLSTLRPGHAHLDSESHSGAPFRRKQGSGRGLRGCCGWSGPTSTSTSCHGLSRLAVPVASQLIPTVVCLPPSQATPSPWTPCPARGTVVSTFPLAEAKSRQLPSPFVS